jgi:hypothetical protein
MDRLSEVLGGPRLWVKRDDCTGLSSGGNKTRKLEFLMADAQVHMHGRRPRFFLMNVPHCHLWKSIAC